MRARMSTVHFPNTVFAISKLNSTFRAMSFGGRIDAAWATSRLNRDETSAKSANLAARSVRSGESRQRVFEGPVAVGVGAGPRGNRPRLSPAARADETRARDNPASRLSSIGSFASRSLKTASANIARTRLAMSPEPFRTGPNAFTSSESGSKLLGWSAAAHQFTVDTVSG